MTLTRRRMMAIGTHAIAFAGLVGARAHAVVFDEAVQGFTQGGVPRAENPVLTMTLPDVAEDGHFVPLDIHAPGAAVVAVFADDNPDADVARFAFGPLSPTGSVSTRMRLARSQNVVAIAKMPDGSLYKAEAFVNVIVGGCGS